MKDPAAPESRAPMKTLPDQTEPGAPRHDRTMPTPLRLDATIEADSRPPWLRPVLPADVLANTVAGEPPPLPQSAAPPPDDPTQPRDLRLGTVLAQRYRIDHLLGTGGCGAVYRARHLGLGIDVAIKFLLAEWANRRMFRERFRREALALSRLVHPCIVGVRDFGEDASDLFLVMEYVRGSTLASHLAPDRPPLSTPRIHRILDQLLEVLELAHQNHIVHRDLKPAAVRSERKAAAAGPRRRQPAHASDSEPAPSVPDRKARSRPLRHRPHL